METLSALLAAIPQPDVAGMARAQQHIDGLLKPPGSLGRLESLAVQLAGLPGLQGQLALSDKAIVVPQQQPPGHVPPAARAAGAGSRQHHAV